MNKLQLSLASFFITLFSFATFSYAQAPATAGPAESMRATCVETVWCPVTDGLCHVDASVYTDFNAIYHRVRITSEKIKALASSPTYIIECISGNGENVCTTGNSQTDVKVFGVDNLTRLFALDGYKFEAMDDGNGNPIANPVQSDALGNFGPIEWQSIIGTAGHTNYTHKFMALNYFSAIGAPLVTQIGGQQQATLDFAVLSEDCVTYSWDPYGRVFDAETLEPLKGVSVELLSKKSDGSFAKYQSELGTVINPQQTTINGRFSFVVPNGTYKLNPTDLSGSYSFPIDQLSAVNIGYASIYKDIYPAQTGAEIVQVGKIQHRDIPLKLIPGKTPQVSAVQILDLETTIQKNSGSYVVEGFVSHPFATLNVWTQKTTASSLENSRYRMIGSTKADREGKFKVVVNHDLLEAGEIVYEVEAVKQADAMMQKPLSRSLWQKFASAVARPVEAQSQTTVGTTTTMKVNPIPNFLQGYAYDAKGKIIPNATVGVYVPFSTKPMHVVSADATGFFKISSEYLPPIGYSLRYTAATGAVTNATTSMFIKQNAAYLEQENVNISKFQDIQGNVAPQPTSATTVKDAQMVAQQQAVQKKGNNNLIVAVVLLVLMVVVSVILGLYLLKKSKTPDMTI